ncbi:MAG TPA: ferrous iron transport protein A [Epsilonproteobacteria bacterium]|nr:ferrous iron transport protein A [Campylobacterota bacterium]HHE05745.1 ferrous iron transport protein A [Campylobacterota bacterium]
MASLGISRNESVSVKHFGWFKSTVQIMTDRTLIALRNDEAACIEVHKVA